MKKSISLFALALFLLISTSVEARRLQAYMSYASFYSPADGPYIETYMIVVGSSVALKKNEGGKYQGTIEVTLIFRQDSVIRDFKKYNLLSPETEDTANINFNFIDQQRFLLPNGTYDVEIRIDDINDNAVPFTANETVEVNFPAGKVSISGIEFVDTYKTTETPGILSKSGYDLVPYILNYYPENVDKLTFYAEVYGTASVFGENEKYLLSCYIEREETQQIYGQLVKVKKESAKAVNVIFSEFDISQLPSGDYNLVVEVRDRNNKQAAIQKIYFERWEPSVTAETELKPVNDVIVEHTFVEMYTNKDTLVEYLRCLYPISSENEKVYARNQMKLGAIEGMQKFLYSFWQARNPQNPGKAWAEYYIEVQKVNNDFSTKIKKGYETDRGRVYLQYGPPNTRTQSYYEPSAYPYEIWHYYSLKNQKNKKFVFYNPDLVTNDFVLIHSDALGEIYDYKWQQKIYGRNNPTNDIDSDGVRPHWGQKSNQYYNSPY